MIENTRKPLANLGLDEDLFPSLNNPSSITSPSSPPSLPTDDEPESSQYLVLLSKVESPITWLLFDKYIIQIQVMSPSSSSGGGTLPKRGVTSKTVGVARFI
jgi:hypothetical protein